MNQQSKLKLIALSLILINIFDAVLHIFTDNIEILRIAGNILLVISTLVILSNSKLNEFKIVLLAGIANLILNIVFIVNNGIGVLGVLFIFISSILSVLYTIKSKVSLDKVVSK